MTARSTGWCLAARAMPGEAQDDEQHNQDKGDERKHFYPTWRAWWSRLGRSRAGVTAGAAVGVGFEGRVSYVPILLVAFLIVICHFSDL